MVADCAMDVCLCCWDAEEIKKEPHAVGVYRMLAAAESSVIKNCSELGHLLAPFSRGTFSHICVKFDWFCGSFPGFIAKERRAAACRAVVFILITLLSLLWESGI